MWMLEEGNWRRVGLISTETLTREAIMTNIYLTRLDAYGRELDASEPDASWFYCYRSEVEVLQRELAVARELIAHAIGGADESEKKT